MPVHAQTPFTNRRYLDAVQDHVVLFDGAMGTSIQRYPLTADDFGGERTNGMNDYLVLTRPDVIEEIHASFLEAGAEVVETDTFRSNPLTLAEFGLQDRCLEINRAAAALARRVCDRFERETGIPRFVAGSMGPSGKLPSGTDPDLSNITFDELADVFYAQAQGLIEGSADLLLIETSQDILEVKAAVWGIQRCFASLGVRIPLQVQVTLDVSGRMLFGTDIASALATLEALPVDVIGLNCSTGPEYMTEPIKYLVEYSRTPISVLPNAGLPINVDGEAVYPMEPDPFSDMVAEFTRWGVGIVGGCCGTRPEHIRRLHEKIKALTPRPPLPQGEGEHTPVEVGAKHALPAHELSDSERGPKAIVPMVSSNMRATAMQQNPGPTMIGERVNTQGSRKVKQLILDEDYDGVVPIAIQQVEAGAHMLDVCVALTERGDEAEQMKALVKKLAMAVEAPLIIDVTDPAVAEAALSVYPGRAIINGNNLENGRERIDQILPIARKYGAGVLSMTIDEDGMAHTRDKKLAIAGRIRDIAVHDYGLSPEDLVFDTLTFPLTTGQEELRNDAVETLEGIRLIKAELPGVMTALGVSNVSFGITPAARGVLNSVFLHHAVEAGLDMAIVNPAHITPYFEIPEDQRKLANDLIFNTDADALPRFIQYFEQNKIDLAGHEAEDPTASMTSEQALHWQIVHRKKEGVEARIDDCLTRQDAVGVLNHVLLPAMKEVGDKFGAGELILPFVLQSAEVMKKTVSYLETFMDKVEGASKGTVVLATVYGDVHDIGKNLVKTILSNNGYTVHDLGKQVPANIIIDKAIELKADAIGLSALLVSTSKQMPLIINELARRGLEIPVLIGGAAINRKFGRRILFLDGTNQPYAPGVFYCKDAFEGLAVMDRLVSGEREAFVAQNEREAYEEMDKPVPVRRARSQGEKTVPPAPSIPTPPFWGAKTIEAMPLEIVLKYLHKPELYRLSWGASNTHGDDWAKLEAEYDARLERMTREALRDRSLQPQAVYGYFPAASDGDDLVIYDPEALTPGPSPSERGEETIFEVPLPEGEGFRVRARELARFSFPRQPYGDYLCISDYIAPVSSAQIDVIALQVVTVGQAASKRFEALQGSDQYSEAYFFHGLAVQAAEATANYVQQQVIAKELSIPPGQGKRYSWGYPACPELADHGLVLKLLPAAASALGLVLSPAYQWIPEQTTAAIFIHHPDAKYFSVGVDRVAQIGGS
ncbi:MAG TPA: homocysteine S-methyltransferase family protein [Candidatus Limnocylindrales bacterium]|nr:homocysteine S-methyltransferase family protein [Candidatus Limnocylindrales bacterium]